MIQTDIIIIGAGPVGLFTVFEAGLMKMRCHLIDSLPQPGGQLIEIYPKKPIYDIPGLPNILAGDLVNNLIEQAAPFRPGFTLGESAVSIEKSGEGKFIVTTDEGTVHSAPAIIIAGGLGRFEPRRPNISGIEQWENNGVYYLVKDPSIFYDKNIVISGGGDSALDWAIYFAERDAKSVALVHRSDQFRAHRDSVEKVNILAHKGRLQLLTYAEVSGIHGDHKLEAVDIRNKEADIVKTISTEAWLPLFGLSPKLGPIGGWGLEIEKNAIVVDNQLDYSTNIPGIFAVGDVNTYPGKLKLILCGFHEATMAVQSAYHIVHPGKKHTMKYTTVQGVQGFDPQPSLLQSLSHP